MLYGPLEPGWIRMRACREDATRSRNNNSSLAPLDPRLDERQRGPAAGSWNNTRPAQDKPRATRSDFSSSVGFSEGPGLPCSCHFSCYRTSVKWQGRCPCAGRGWFTNISGEYNYTAPPAEQPYAASGARGEGGGGGGGHWKQRLAFCQPYFNVCFQEYNRTACQHCGL